GNVSLYNESRGRDIDPTPVVAVVGMVDRLVSPPPGVGLVAGTRIVVLGAEPDTLSGSQWAWRRGHKAGSPPALDLDAHRAVCDLVRDLVADGLVLGVHDTADGGLGVALAEMAAASGVGAVVQAPDGADHRWLFGESPSRFVLSVDPAAIGELHRRHTATGVPAGIVGEAGGDRFTIAGLAGGGGGGLPVAALAAPCRGTGPPLPAHGPPRGCR